MKEYIIVLIYFTRRNFIIGRKVIEILIREKYNIKDIKKKIFISINLISPE